MWPFHSIAVLRQGSHDNSKFAACDDAPSPWWHSNNITNQHACKPVLCSPDSMPSNDNITTQFPENSGTTDSKLLMPLPSQQPAIPRLLWQRSPPFTWHHHQYLLLVVETAYVSCWFVGGGLVAPTLMPPANNASKNATNGPTSMKTPSLQTSTSMTSPMKPPLTAHNMLLTGLQLPQATHAPT